MSLFNRQVEVAHMSYRHIAEQERYQIKALLEAGLPPGEIAEQLGRHRSTIYRELARNAGLRGYRPEQANTLAIHRRTEASARCRTSLATWELVSLLIQEEWSPEQITGWLQKHGHPAISHEWIYQYIYRNKQQGGTLHLHLRCQKERRKRYGSGRSRRGQIPHRVSIDQRPSIVDARKRLGDWEGDTIVGKCHKGSVVTLVERKSLLVRMRLLEDRTADSVGSAIINLLKPLHSRRHTLTVDNGKEFSGHECISSKLGTNVYFCKTYAPYQRGRNEQTNGLIRQYIPKSSSLSELSHADIRRIESRLNNRPRKSLGFRTPNEVFFGNKGVALRS
jgi:IS30 family transposase